MIHVIGGGLYGLTFAHFLKGKEYRIIERDPYIGGYCRSVGVGYRIVIDRAGHIFHSLKEDDIAWLNGLGCNLIKQERHARIYNSGKGFNKPEVIDYPFQTNYKHLNKKVAGECEKDFLKAQKKGNKSGFDESSIGRSMRSKFGNAMMKYFFTPYNKKYWRFPDTKIELIKSNRIAESGSKGYNDSFYYPQMGGAGMVVNKIAETIKRDNCLLNCNIEYIDVDKKIIKMNGVEEKWETIVSSIPLHHMVKYIKNAPYKVKSAAKNLKYTSMYVLSFIYKTKNNSPLNTHWIYASDPKMPFMRAYFMKSFSTFTCPDNYDVVSFEISMYKDKKLGLVSDVNMLESLEIDGNNVVLPIVDYLNPAYTIFDKGWKKRVDIIQEYLMSKNIYSKGRYGSWAYMDMGETIRDAKSLALEFNKKEEAIDNE